MKNELLQPSRADQKKWRADDQIPRYLWLAGLFILILIGGVGGWTATAQINGAVIATGVFKVQSFSKSIQHLEGGLIREILVKDGDTVVAGDVLIRLDQTDLLNQIRGEESQGESKANQIDLLIAELEDLRKLQAKGLVQTTRLKALERQIASLQGEEKRHQANADRFLSQLARLDIKAPIDGIVHGLAFHTLEGVIAPGQEVLKIIPQTEELVIEAKVAPSDIDQVWPDQKAAIRLSSVNKSITPELDARITHVSADLTHDETRDFSYYTVLLEVTDIHSGTMEGVSLLPGMPADVFISTEARTVLSYLVRPLGDQFHRTFRE